MSVRDKIIAIAREELGEDDNRDIPNIHELDRYFIDVGKSPSGADKTTSWCGLFACWVLKQALMERGKYVTWRYKIVDSTNRLVQLVDAEGGDEGKGIRPGDVGVIRHRIHHFVVEEAFPDSELLVTISGNYLGRAHDCIRRTRDYTRRGLWYYYRIVAD